MGTVLLVACLVATAAWVVHLTALASLVELSRSSTAALWAMHGFTVAMAAVCVGVIVLGRRTGRRCTVPEDHGTPAGRTAFLGWLAVVVGATNLLLIVFEGSYVVLIDRYA